MLRLLLPIVLVSGTSASAPELRHCSLPGSTPNPSHRFQRPLLLHWDNWATSQLTTTVAGILLSQKFGFEVKLVERTTESIYEDVATEITHMAFEVWPAAQRNFTKYSTWDNSESAPVGKAVTIPYWHHPTKSRILETCSRRVDAAAGGCEAAGLTIEKRLQRALNTSKGRAHFAGTGRVTGTCPEPEYCDVDGIWRPPICSRQGGCDVQLLHISPYYDQGLVEGIILDLDLPIEVVYLGLAKHAAKVWQLHADGKGGLFYWYEPSTTIGELSMNDFDTAIVSMDSWKEMELRKIFWSGLLTEGAEDAAAFAGAFQLTREDVAGMNLYYDGIGKNVQLTACWWLQSNEDRWKDWIVLPSRLHRSFSFCGADSHCNVARIVLFASQLVLGFILLFAMPWLSPFQRKMGSPEALRESIDLAFANVTSPGAASMQSKSDHHELMEPIHRAIDVVEGEEIINLKSFQASLRQVPMFLKHYRSDIVFKRKLGVPPGVKHSDTYHTELSHWQHYIFILTTVSWLPHLFKCLGYGLISGAIATVVFLLAEFSRFQAAGDRGSGIVDSWGEDMLRTVGDSLTSIRTVFSFFPSFLMIGYIGFSVQRWHSFRDVSMNLWGKLQGVALHVRGALTTHDRDGSYDFAFKMYRYLNLLHFYSYQTSSAWLTLVVPHDLCKLGLASESEAVILADRPADFRRGVVLVWITKLVHEGLQKQLLSRDCANHVLEQISQVRGWSGASPVVLSEIHPNMWATLMTIVVDLLILIYVLAVPFTTFVYDHGPFQGLAVVSTTMLCIPWCSKALMMSLHDPYFSCQDSFNVDSILTSLEQDVFNIMQTIVDEDLNDEDRGKQVREGI